ncbi:MAG: alanine--tRNA ligase, partial [Alphaproteobacteria bacterium]
MKHLAEIRTAFLSFFKARDHKVVASSSLVPRNDPTLLFTTAGMVQFKDVFTGLENPPHPRAVSSQKCLRAGGKHNDLENVGYTARHHTFFEMLGNFSFGDYFKDVAIEAAWTFITQEMQLPKDRLLVTVYSEDEEAAALWRKIAGISDSRIIRIPTTDNFWSMGDTGPCGPCSEIFFDHGEGIPGGPPGSADEDGDRFIEVWNLVFMQFDQMADGTRVPLPKPSIDTGMGLERISAVLQGAHNNYETDLFKFLIETSMDLSKNANGIQSHRVIADHLRASAFLIAEGILPANEGRGYVLRRIMRRAMRHAHLLGTKEPLLWQLVPALSQVMGTAYPELVQAEPQIISVLRNEEERFRETLGRGLKLLQEATSTLPAGTPLSGEVAFKLYDTYGFPLDLTQDVLKASQRTVDTDSYNQAMEQQRAQARASWAGSGETKDAPIWFDILQDKGTTEFLGYDSTQAEGIAVALVLKDQLVEKADAGQELYLLANQTPFYGESGGQMGDTGVIESAHAKIQVLDTKKKLGKLTVHHVKILSGTVKVGEVLKLMVDGTRRNSLRANHSATHLLHAALRHVLGNHVMQKGSLVAPELLRFDFAHNQPLTAAELTRTEQLVNQFICENHVIKTEIMSPDAAIASGAMALFGERYGDEVRVLSMGEWQAQEPFSVELCGGTHVARTGDIGFFKITTEAGIAAGVRRISAKTNLGALEDINQREEQFDRAIALLKTTPDNFYGRLEGLIKERRDFERQVAELRQQLALRGSNTATDEEACEQIGSFQVASRIFHDLPAKELKPLVDSLKHKIRSGIVIVASACEGKVSLVIGVTNDLTTQVSAVDLVHIGSEILGG